VRCAITFTASAALVWAAGSTAHWSQAQKERFLLTARIESEQYAGKGLTHSQKAMLSDGRVTHPAHIQSIDIYQPLFRGKDGSTEKDFKDSWKFDVAGYRLARLLGISNMTPVSVPRVVNGKPSAVTWWVDDVLMDERDRIARNIQPPDITRWNHQMDTIRIFDQLIYNMDRSQENLLIDRDWNVWMIDESRAFRKWKELRNPEKITHCDPQLLSGLEHLRRSDVERELSSLLTADEIDGLMARRDLVVAKIRSQASSVGWGAFDARIRAARVSKRW
jgi:hypothetical protein